MWLSVRPNVTPGRARAWYTHIMAESVKRKLRRFTGMVDDLRAVERRDRHRMVEAAAQFNHDRLRQRRQRHGRQVGITVPKVPESLFTGLQPERSEKNQ